MEIERKFKIKSLPDLLSYPSKTIIQGYISISPVIRIRKANDLFYLTCKGKGLMAREEFEILISEDQFHKLSQKVDYNLIYKTRYLIPFEHYTIELDVFESQLEGLIMAEVEFSSIEEANNFTPPEWFGDDVTSDSTFHNSYLCQLKSHTPT